MEDRFREAYERLNQDQRAAVDTIEGPVMVIAGPGTGKTQILTLRIAHILRTTDTAPSSILALTFTESGARAMRERLREYIGPAAHKVAIHTFHEFAGTLIRAYPDVYTRAIGGRPASDLEKIALVEQILDTNALHVLRPKNDTRYYVNPILSAIQLMKREYITPDRFADITRADEEKLETIPKIHEKGAHKGKVRGEYHALEKIIQQNKELLFVYRAYDAALREARLYDFEDMIYETVEALSRDESMLRDLQERFHYILADEHQDVNGSQNKILDLLASFHEYPNIFVVGDEKQAIFRFQGASLENFLYFGDRFSHARTIALTHNYRSKQQILDFSHALITVENSPSAHLRIPLTAVREGAATIELREYPHEAIEDTALVTHLTECVKHVPHRDIAVIVRSNREVEHYAFLLRQAGIPVRASADSDILGHPLTTSVRTLLTAIAEPENEHALFTLLHEPYWNIPAEDLVRVLRERSLKRPLAAIIHDTAYLSEIGVKNPDALHRIHEILTDARTHMLAEPPHRITARVLKESGCVDLVMTRDPHDGGRALRRLYDEIESYVRTNPRVTLSDVLRMFARRIEYRLQLTAPFIDVYDDAVHVTTAHKSKGLEYSCVYVPHLNDRSWGESTPRKLFHIPISQHINDDEFDALDDERKLLYVALTRAKDRLYLSYARQSVEGKEQLGTPLLDTLWDAHVVRVDTSAEVAAFDSGAVFRNEAKEAPLGAELLTATLARRGLSATSLNNYLQSPWDYVYRNVLRVPDVQSENLQFGTALHAVLARAFQYRRHHAALPSAHELGQYLREELVRLPLSAHEYTRLHERGYAALLQYLEFVTMPAHTQEEVKMEALLATDSPLLPYVKLTGALDRIDFDTDPMLGGSVVRVVDYKSGKPKTRGEIEGTTKDSDGGYKRQLVFYALLLSLQDDAWLHTRTFTLSFLEADAKGVIHEETYTISDEEIEDLKKQILDVVREITTGSFLSHDCDPERSRYCHLVDMLRTLH
jgi:DNA helicase-2/ATP-dependent DNA helicase PcrA